MLRKIIIISRSKNDKVVKVYNYWVYQFSYKEFQLIKLDFFISYLH